MLTFWGVVFFNHGNGLVYKFLVVLEKQFKTITLTVVVEWS